MRQDQKDRRRQLEAGQGAYKLATLNPVVQAASINVINPLVELRKRHQLVVKTCSKCYYLLWIIIKGVRSDHLVEFFD